MTHVNNTAIVAVVGGARTIRNYTKQTLNPGVYFSYINNFFASYLSEPNFRIEENISRCLNNFGRHTGSWIIYKKPDLQCHNTII
jgi:hypothetical protein